MPRTPLLIALCTLSVLCACSDDAAPDADTGQADTSDADADATQGDAGQGDVADASAQTDAPGPAPDLVVMTFNIKADDAELVSFNPATSWDFVGDDEDDRRDRVVAQIDEAAPALVCLQEARPEPVDWLVAQLEGDWDFHGAQRGGDNAPTDMNPVMWRTDRFALAQAGDFWLSETPTVPGSTFAASDDDNSRMASWVVLDDLATGDLRFVLCTHWSLDADARVRAAELVRQQLVALGADAQPTLVMGDLNATEDSREYGILLGRESPDGELFEDAYRVAHPDRADDERTYHAFEGNTVGSRIDFVLASPSYDVAEATIIRTEIGLGYASDHYPVVVRFSSTSTDR